MKKRDLFIYMIPCIRYSIKLYNEDNPRIFVKELYEEQINDTLDYLLKSKVRLPYKGFNLDNMSVHSKDFSYIITTLYELTGEQVGKLEVGRGLLPCIGHLYLNPVPVKNFNKYNNGLTIEAEYYTKTQNRVRIPFIRGTYVINGINTIDDVKINTDVNFLEIYGK